VRFDFTDYLHRQKKFSEKTFGPGPRDRGIVDHIRKELVEIEADPGDPKEWLDVATLALDGALRCGVTPEWVAGALLVKLIRNENRTWPDWRKVSLDKAIEHDRSRDAG
jgi:hypothetical protein